MRMIKDLMDAFADHIELPLLLVNSYGELDYKVEIRKQIITLRSPIQYLLDMKTIALHINTPTVMALSDENFKESFCIVTPIFNVKNSKKFIIAGPFHLESSFLANADKVFQIISDKDIADARTKLKNLYSILISKSQVENKFIIPNSLVKLIQSIGNQDFQVNDYNEHIQKVFKEFLEMEAFDFLGLARRNSENIFVIQHVGGENVQHLQKKYFHMGEGLLGKSAILGEDFYWNQSEQLNRLEFFHKYDIFPSYLFGFTLKKDNFVEEILFGGYFNKVSANETMLLFLKSIIQLLSKKKYSNKNFSTFYLQTIFANWLDLMNMMGDVTDRKQIAYLILDFCQTLNNDKCSCFSTFQGEKISRGMMNQEVLLLHQKALEHSNVFHFEKVWKEGNCIHFYLDFHFDRYGLFTVQFEEETDFFQITFILGMIDQLLKQNFTKYKTNMLPEEYPIFDLLHESINEMNQHQFYLTTIAINIIRKLSEIFELEEDKKEILLNIGKVGVFQIEFLTTHIAHTREWKLLLEAKNMMANGKNKGNNYRLEMKIILFLLKVVFLEEKNPDLDFLTIEQRDIFLKTHKWSIAMLKNTSTSMEGEIEPLEEIIDLKDIIATLALTAREKEILYLILEGLNNQEVANYLQISIHTVKNHVTNIFKKLNVSDRIQAMAKIYRIKYNDV